MTFLRILHKKQKLVPHVAAASHAAVVTSPLFRPAEPSGLCSLLSPRETARLLLLEAAFRPSRAPVRSELGAHGPAKVGSPAHSPRIPQGTLPRGDASPGLSAERSEGRRRGVRTADSAQVTALLSGAAGRLQHILGRANCRERILSAASFLTREKQ